MSSIDPGLSTVPLSNDRLFSGKRLHKTRPGQFGDFSQVIQAYAAQPLTHQLILSLLKGYRRPNDLAAHLKIKT